MRVLSTAHMLICSLRVCFVYVYVQVFNGIYASLYNIYIMQCVCASGLHI